jgi:pilus assembly protein CpaE
MVTDDLGDRKLSRSNVEARMGGIEAAISHYQDNTTPQLVLLESDSDGPEMLKELDRLAEVCDPGTNVLLIGLPNDISLYRELMRRGIAEYLVGRVAPQQILHAVTAIFEEPGATPIGRSIAFIGSRGGSGSSSLAHNVAWHLGQEYGEEVSVIDLDITFGTAALSFNVETKQTLEQVLADPSRLDDQLLDRFLIEYDEHIRLLASPSNLNAEGSMPTESLDRLLGLLRRRSSFVILDLPHRWTPWVQQILLEADETVVVGVLDLSGLRDTKNLVNHLRQQRGATSPVHMVLNRRGASKKTELSPKDFETAVEMKPVAIIPHAPELFGTASNNGQMLGQVNRKHKSVETLRKLAILVGGRQTGQKVKKNLLSQLGLMKNSTAKAT